MREGIKGSLSNYGSGLSLPDPGPGDPENTSSREAKASQLLSGHNILWQSLLSVLWEFMGNYFEKWEVALQQ